jgi:hypothetical protein
MPQAGDLDFILTGCHLKPPSVAILVDVFTDTDGLEVACLNHSRDAFIAELKTHVGSDFKSNMVFQVIHVHDWFHENYLESAFSWTQFDKGAYLSTKKRVAAINQSAKAAKDAQAAAAQAARAALPAPVTSSTTALAAATASAPDTDYSSDVFSKNKSRTALLSVPGSIESLQPHPLWRTPFATAVRSRVSTGTFMGATVTLQDVEPSSIITFYRLFAQTAKTAEIDLIPITEFKPDAALWPMNRCANTIFEMNDLLVVKLSMDGVLNLADETLSILFTSTLENSDSNLKGYVFLHKLLARAVGTLQQCMPSTPTLAGSGSILGYGKDLLTYFDMVGACGSRFPLRTQSVTFLSALAAANIVVDSFSDRIQNVPISDELPWDLNLEQLVIAISKVRTYTPTGQFVHRLRSGTERTAPRPPETALASRNKSLSRSRDPAPFYTGAQAQCNCGAWGHERDNCRFMAQLALAQEYVLANPAWAKLHAAKFIKSQNKADGLRTVRQLRRHHPDAYNGFSDDEILRLLADDGSDDEVPLADFR